MNRMPQRPTLRSEADRAMVEPRWPHERVASVLYDGWRRGRLEAGTHLTVTAIAHEHTVSVGTAHRAITLLDQWGALRVRQGCPSVVLACPNPLPPAPADTPATAIPTTTPACAETSTARDLPVTPRPAAVPLLRLTLLHLGRPVRSVTTQADPDDFATLQQLLADAVRRAGADRARIGEYELQVHLADQPQPVTTVVMAA